MNLTFLDYLKEKNMTMDDFLKKVSEIKLDKK